MHCIICLEGTRVRKYCCVYVHKRCLQKWSRLCPVCKQDTGVPTNKEYKYVPPEPEPTEAEIQEQLVIMRRIERENEVRSILQVLRELREEQISSDI